MIPQKTWELDKKWNELGKDISDLRNRFIAATEGEEGLVDEFMFETGNLMTRMRHLREESTKYIKEIYKEKNPDKLDNLTDWDTV